MVSIRTTTIDNVVTNDRPLMVTANGQEGVMLLTPSIILTKIVKETDRVYGYGKTKYGLARIYWEPTDPDTVEILTKLYVMKRNFIKELDAIIKLTEK